jgi:hypothetical protein
MTSPADEGPPSVDDELPAGIGRPATGALREAGITRLSDLPRHRERELLALHGVGPKAVRLLREALAERGLGFADD